MTSKLDSAASRPAIHPSTVDLARKSAQQALFGAASRVLSYHTARLDARLARLSSRGAVLEAQRTTSEAR